MECEAGQVPVFKMSGGWRSLSSLGVMFAVAPVLAQGSSPSDNQRQISETAGLETVIVTARRREESLQETPVTVTALSREYLESRGATTFEDFAVAVPGISVVGNNSPENKIVLRGVSTGVASRDEGAVIGLYIDDVPVGSRRFNPDLRLYDVERVEVLRGPQGTLFGEGSIGGTIRYVSTKPDLGNYGARLFASVSDTRKGDINYDVAGVVNLPIVEDKFGIRLVGYHINESGFVDNITLDKENVNETDTVGGRIIARLKPVENLSITASVLHQDSDVPGKAQFDPDLGDLNQARNFEEALGDEFTLVNLAINWYSEQVSIDSSTAYFDRSVINNRDISPLFGGLPGFLDDLTTFESFAQEIRVTSNEGLYNDRLDWVLGVFYRDDKEFFTQDAQAVDLGGDIFDSDNTLNREQVAIFVEFDFALTDRLTATAGARWFDIDQDGRNVNAGLIAGLAPGVVDIINTDASESGVSPKFRIAYDAINDVLLYALASRGFREGGPTGQGVPPDPTTGAAAPKQFDSDALWNYEVGFKTSWLENRLTVNGAVFYIDWEDIQTNFIRSDGHTFTVNAGAARSAGGEIEVRALLFPNLELFNTVSYVDSELTEDQLPPGDGMSGDRIPGVPDITLTIGFDYSRPIIDGIEGVLNFNYQHVGDSFNGFTSSTGISAATADKQDSYNISNLRGSMRNENWEVTLFVDNIWDERAVLFFNRIVGDVRINTTRPRTVGASFKAYF